MPTAISLFSGCGGSDAGLTGAGFDIIMANDIAPYARDLYEANLPETDYVLGDVADIQAFPNADVLVGCYPCQGFSMGGVRDPNRKINYLYREFDRALRIIKPKAFIVENVAGMARSGHQHLLRADAIHLLTHDGLHLAQHAQAERQPGINAGRKFADHAGAQHQLMADDLGVGGRFFGGGEE